MYRRILAALLCTIMVSASLTSCGKSISTGDSGENSASQSANENSGSESTADAEIMNFTAPEKGDTIIEMNIRDYGTVKIRLFPEYADKGVENFIGLAKDGYYDGLSFHRVIKDFMIQGGDPLGTGQGGKSMWGSSFDGGTDPHLTHLAGALAYANSGSTASNGSQFYIVTGMQITEDTLKEFESAGYSFSESVKSNLLKAGYGYPFLDGSYTIFGQVIDGLDIIFDIQNVQTDSKDKPTKDVIMDSVKVTEYNGEEIKWFISDYDYQPPTEAPVENVPVANFTAPEKGETVVNLKIKDYGDVKIKLFPEYADKGVENFVELVKKGYYDGLTFHRVIKDFMIQGGDPNGNGTGGESTWGGKFEGGTDPHIIHVTGAVAYANSGATSTNGSQFYIVTGEVYDQSQLDELSSYGYKLSDSQKELYKKCGGTPFLDGNYTVFGQVYEGLDIIFKIQNVETDTTTDKPVDSVIIESATVGEYDGEQIRWYTEDYGIKRGGEDAAAEATTSAETASEESSSSEETTTEE